jgi:hypothetical protein
MTKSRDDLLNEIISRQLHKEAIENLSLQKHSGLVDAYYLIESRWDDYKYHKNPAVFDLNNYVFMNCEDKAA